MMTSLPQALLDMAHRGHFGEQATCGAATCIDARAIVAHQAKEEEEAICKDCGAFFRPLCPECGDDGDWPLP